jgi:WD40 repeat protein
MATDGVVHYNRTDGVLYYNRSDGHGALGRVTAPGDPRDIRAYPAGTFATHWDTITSLSGDRLLYYRAFDGSGAIGQITDTNDLDDLRALPAGTFATTTTAIASLSGDRLLFYRAFNGSGAIGQITDTNDLHDLRALPAGTFATDWAIVTSSPVAYLAVSRCPVDASITAIEMSPGETPQPLVAVADTSSAVTVILALSGTRLARKPIPGTIAATAFADGGQSVAVGGSTGVRLFSLLADRSWKVDTIGPVNALAAVGLAGDWVATAAARTVRLLSSTDGHERWAAPVTLPQAVTRVASSTDGAWIGTGCADRTTRVLDATTGTQTFAVTADGKVRALAFQPGHRLLATANEDGSVVLIDVATATEHGRIERLFGCSHLAFVPGGMLLATAWDDNTVSIYDVTTPGPPPKLRELTVPAPVSGLVANPRDGTIATLVTGSTSVLVYDPGSGQEQIRILHPSPVQDVAISADGAFVATACDDDIVRVWPSSIPST